MGCDIHGYLELVHSDDYVAHICNIPRDRAYDWFGILAGVRNYVNAIPISEPKGIPEKLSWKAQDEFDGYGSDGHSHSWLTWKEIRDYDWESVSTDGRVSVVNLETGEESLKASYINPSLLKEDEKFDHLTRTAKDLVPFIWKGFLKFMEHLASHYGDEKVRIVYFFDN